MALFRRSSTETRGLLQDLNVPQRSVGTQAGIVVNDEQAMRLGAVWACVDLLAELVSTLPVDEFRRAPSGHPVAIEPKPPLLEDPEGDGTGFEVWARKTMMSALLRGNAYGHILQLGSDGWPVQMESVHPSRVSWAVWANGGRGEWQLDGQSVEKWPEGPLWHMPAYVLPGARLGIAPITYAAETIGLGLAARRFGGQWFRDGAHPSSVFESEHEITQRQAEEIKSRIMGVTDGNREPIVLGLGGKLHAIQVSPNESQFLETIKANADDVARFFFRRPPGEGGQVTYANVEARSLDLLTYTVNGWLVRLERALSRLRPRPRFVKFNADAIVRVDMTTRYKSHEMALRNGWKSANEVRHTEDMPPISDGDAYNWPPYTTSTPAAATPAPGMGQPSSNGRLPATPTNRDGVVHALPSR